MLISLIGMPGSGKSSVGRLVADALGCPLIDLDECIEKAAGKPIPEIFAESGEAGFRKLEAEQLRKTLARYGGQTAVLSPGGGTVTLPGAPALLREKSLCIWLRASLETLQAHLQGDASRPLLSQPGSLQALLEARESLYAEAAEVILDTDGLSPEEIADEIIISVL